MFKKIYVEITNVCNMNCSFCSKDNRKKQEMTLEDFEIILNKIKPYTSYIYLHVKGEPLLHSKLDEILRISKEKNFKVNITTNGTLLEKQKEVLINDTSVRQINVSLHSNIYDDEYIEKVIKSTDYIISKTNIVFSFRLWNITDKNISNDKIIKTLENHYNVKILNDVNNIKLSNNLYLNFDKVFNWPNINNNIYNEFGKCYGLKSHIGILVDGTVIPCCLDSNGIINLGNIFKKDLDEIINSNRYQNILKNFNDNKKCEELCRHCDFI